jgi:hypothetical protein
MRTMMLITLVTLITVAAAKADTIDVKVKSFITNEATKIKTYQKEQWENGKEQNAKNWAKIKSLFTKVKNNVTQD